MMYKKEELYLTSRNSIFYFVRRVPRYLIQYYSPNRISSSLKTKAKLKNCSFLNCAYDISKKVKLF